MAPQKSEPIIYYVPLCARVCVLDIWEFYSKLPIHKNAYYHRGRNVNLISGAEIITNVPIMFHNLLHSLCVFYSLRLYALRKQRLQRARR